MEKNQKNDRRAVKGAFSAKSLCLSFVSLCFCCGLSFSSPVDSDRAEQIARDWMAMFSRPLESDLSNVIDRVETVNDQVAGVLYHVVALVPEGYLVVPGDDRLGDVIAFSAKGHYDDSLDNPLSVMLEKDMTTLIEAVETIPISVKGQIQVEGLGVGLISDLRVEPLLQSKWDQGDVSGAACYNYYTPNNDPVGCVATVMAQVMRYHTYPDFGVGVHQYDIKIDGVLYTSYHTRGGNGIGGIYDWANMPLDPSLGVTAIQRQAIGALCYDAGLSVNMSYTSSGSGATTGDASSALKGLFGYDNAVFGWNYGINIPASLLVDMVNPSLDAGAPVILGISRVGGGHAVVADGYGYIGSTLYHHINLGWGGNSDAWYALPTIDASSYTYTSVEDCCYNIFADDTGEIVSGRVLDQGGNPISGVTVQAKFGGSVEVSDLSDSRGIYALKDVQSNRTYTVHAELSPHVFNDRFVTTGKSVDASKNCGNLWGIDLVSTVATPPTALAQEVDLQSGEIMDVTLQAYDEGLPDPPGSLVYIISDLPAHGRLLDSNFPGGDPNGFDPNGVPIDSVPYVLTGNTVRYQSCSAFSGVDNFSFKANDGGVAPLAGDSASAEVAVNVSSDFFVTYDPFSNWISNYFIGTDQRARRMQVIFHAGDILGDISGSRLLTSVALSVDTASGLPLTNFSVRLKHTLLDVYPSSSNNFDNSGWTIVYQGTFNPSVGWSEIEFESPFEYNGLDNLMVDISFNNSSTSSGGSVNIYPVGATTYRVVGSYSDDGSNPFTWTVNNVGTFTSDGMPYMTFGQKIVGTILPGDCNRDCQVSMGDIAAMASAWLSRVGQGNYDRHCDIAPETPDNTVNMLDLALVVENWLESSFN